MRARFEDLPDVLSIAEVAEVMRLSRGAIYNAVRAGELPSFKIGRRIMVSKKVLQRKLQGKKN